jgi:hypothetical protein
MTLDQIYKAFKHGYRDFDEPIKKVYRALKYNYLQVILVDCDTDHRKLYNYIPEEDNFELVMMEEK